MTSVEPERAAAAAPAARSGRRGAAVLAGVLIAGFVIAFSARAPIVLTTAPVDDTLFMRLGMHLAAGQWLGTYDQLTLAKGPGFPGFLALANLAGLPFPLALALFHAACAGFAAAVFGRLGGSRWLGLAVLAALLLAPTLYDTDLLRVFRDVFYASLCLAFVAAATALVTGCLGRPRSMAGLTGALGAWAWLTREEGVWLAPFVLGLLAVPLLRSGAAGASPPRLASRVRALAPAGRALLVGTALVLAFGLVNRAVYGRFVVNEIKDAAFQAALGALQDASAPFHREGIPVPAAARARIYAVSPAFAALKEPVLDGPLQASATQWGCQENPRYCGDFAGGWFQWALRDSAAAKGWHASPATAAGFYRRLAQEVRRACANGRLTCRHWPVPLAPPMRAGELADVAASFGKVFHVFTFGDPVQLQPRPSELTGPGAKAMLAFVGASEPREPVAQQRVTGWFVAPGAPWFRPQAGEGVKIVDFLRADSSDLAARSGDPHLRRRRFVLTAECPAEACPVTLALADGRIVALDLATLTAGAHPAAGGTLFIEDPGVAAPPPLLKDRFSQLWIAVEARLPPLFRALVFLGGAAWLGLAGLALVRRRVSSGLIVATALLAAVVARMLILALTDALSFAAAGDNYSLPGVGLLLVFSVLAIHQAAAAAMRAGRTRALAPAAATQAASSRRAA